MRIAHVVTAYPDRVTGPRNSVTMLSKELAGLDNVESTVFSDVIDNAFEFNGVTVYPAHMLLVAMYDVVIFAGVYNKRFVGLARACRGGGVPYVVSPRSSLVKKSIHKSWWKKILFIYGYGYPYLRKASALHFLTQEERANSIMKDIKNFVVSNIVPACSSGGGRKEKIIGYVGRYDLHHKGLDVFLKAVALAKNNLARNGWRVILHGPDFKHGKAQLDSIVAKYELASIVSLNGSLHGQSKNDFLSKVSVFFHTSRYEGQPQAVMEAMIRGCAIMVTPGTNMGSIVHEAACGAQVCLEPRAIANFLSELPADLVELLPHQERARSYAECHFSEQIVISEFIKYLSDVVHANQASEVV